MAQLADVVDLPVDQNRHQETKHKETRRNDPGRTGGVLGRTVTRTNQLVAGTIGSITEVAGDGVRAATRRLTEEPVDATDDWGRDPVLVRNMMLLAQLRWDVATGGDQRLPKRGGALVVVNAPTWASSPTFTAFALSEAIDRPVRFVGRRTMVGLNAFDRRIGGLIDHPDEVAGALRAGEIVVLGAGSARGPRGVGTVDHTIVGAALSTGTRVFPAATSSSPFTRHARVEVGAATRPPRKRRGPLTELELADQLRSDIRSLLDEMGDVNTGTPLDWLPFGGIGAR